MGKRGPLRTNQITVFVTSTVYSNLYIETSILYTYKYFTRSLQPFNMQMYRTIISALITCNQFRPLVCKFRIDLHLVI